MAGNAIVGQSGGPTSVINASLCGVIEAAEGSHVIDGIFGMRFGVEGFLDGQVIDLEREKKTTIKGLMRTPSSALGSCRYKLRDSDLPRVLEILRSNDIRYFFLIGGNDTMDTIARVETYCRTEGYDLYGVGVPKTVDNDLYGTDHTPGYPSAARYVALSVQQSGRLAADMRRVDQFVIHQTVGRDAGWLAAAAALARTREGDAPHLIYLPERPIERQRFVADSLAAIERHGYVSIVCGEGVVWSDGTPVSASIERDRFANVEFGAMGGTSAAVVLHRILSQTGGGGAHPLRGEFQITESLPMCAIDRATPNDLKEAYACGRRAVELAETGTSGVMVTIVRMGGTNGSDLGTIPLGEVAARTKPMPDEFITPNGHDVTSAFTDYLKPLVGELPTFSVLENFSVGGTV